ncbi:MAG: hypothetical protein LBN10_02510 [Propionibacteriaceae bacterium]|nr:hypothetical protein [Propionibacteriaceae bacterium]
MNRTKTITIGVLVGLLALALIGGCFLAFRWVQNWGQTPLPPPDARCVSTLPDASAEITPEQAQYASIMAGIAASRGLQPRAVSIALATAFQESGIRNLDYGDRDSLGLFQQRPSQGWGTPEEIMDPWYSTNTFFDAMEAMVPNWANEDIGDVAQAVQRSGFPDAYDQHVDRARLLATALSGQTHAAWSCLTPDIAAPDPRTLLTSITSSYGATATATLVPASGTSPARIEVSASTQDIAWSVAAFAQSWTSTTGVSQVLVGNVRWQASTTVLPGWVGISDGLDSPTQVRITF